MRPCSFFILTFAVVGLGCGAKSKMADHPAQAVVGGAMGAREAADQAAQPPKAATPLPRKIIYNASMSIIADDLSKAEKELEALVRKEKGYVISSEVAGSPGAPRSGQWKIRVPVDHLEGFREAVARLGDVERNTTDSQDVTDEYYDLDARIKNKKTEEARLLHHLEKSTGKLEEILAVEREVSRVRGEVEQMQGRQQVLAKLSAMTTVTVTLHERRSYVPPEAPAFTTTIGRTFSGSLDALIEVGKGIVLVAVAVAPWVPIVALAGLLIVLAWRRHRHAFVPAADALAAEDIPPPTAD
jgi:Domain of unknown function (DUF4349)